MHSKNRPEVDSTFDRTQYSDHLRSLNFSLKAQNMQRFSWHVREMKHWIIFRHRVMQSYIYCTMWVRRALTRLCTTQKQCPLRARVLHARLLAPLKLNQPRTEKAIARHIDASVSTQRTTLMWAFCLSIHTVRCSESPSLLFHDTTWDSTTSTHFHSAFLRSPDALVAWCASRAQAL
jgi:hypothetical protein